MLSADDKRTSLHLAASTGATKVLEFLIKKGAKINSEDRWGGTPLCDAVREGHTDCAAKLRDAGGLLGYDEVRHAERQVSRKLAFLCCSLSRSREHVRTLPRR